MDFDDVKRVWDECDHKLAVAFRLNARRLRSMVTPLEDANANQPTAEDIDYTMPVVLARRHLDAHPFMRMLRATAASIRSGGRADQIVGKFHDAVMRMLRRYLTLRG